MRKNIQAVLNAWWAGEPCNRATCSTDGRTVFSYALPVARKQDTRNGRLVTIRSAGPTHTTRTQLTAVRTFVKLSGGHLVETASL